MTKDDTEAGVKLLSLLKHQRYLYHQLKLLSQRQYQLEGTKSSELILQIISGRRKLVEKLQELDSKLRPIRANWPSLSSKIGHEHKIQAHKMANQVKEIIGEILAVAPSSQNLPLSDSCKFDELFVESLSK